MDTNTTSCKWCSWFVSAGLLHKYAKVSFQAYLINLKLVDLLSLCSVLVLCYPTNTVTGCESLLTWPLLVTVWCCLFAWQIVRQIFAISLQMISSDIHFTLVSQQCDLTHSSYTSSAPHQRCFSETFFPVLSNLCTSSALCFFLTSDPPSLTLCACLFFHQGSLQVFVLPGDGW